jgi:hypothetical protein
MKPSDLKMTQPYDSVFRNSECETVARNIMIILARTGNEFRDLSAQEYSDERRKDGEPASVQEMGVFEKVVFYTKSEDNARHLSKYWN